MRDIKFRAWDSKEKNFIYFGIIQGLLSECDSQYIHNYVHLGSIEQFTGLKDKNGKEIYEGDTYLINIGEGAQSTDSIAWSEFRAGFVGKTPNGETYPITMCEIEIIGNIHENPELLK